MDTILYAEDTPEGRKVGIEFLQIALPNHNIISVVSGNALEEKLNDDIGDLRVVITDNSILPGPNGSEIIREYAQREGFEHIPFILYYAGDGSTGEMLAKEYDNVFYLPKSAGLQYFKEFLKGVLTVADMGFPTQSSQ